MYLVLNIVTGLVQLNLNPLQHSSVQYNAVVEYMLYKNCASVHRTGSTLRVHTSTPVSPTPPVSTNHLLQSGQVDLTSTEAIWYPSTSSSSNPFLLLEKENETGECLLICIYIYTLTFMKER